MRCRYRRPRRRGEPVIVSASARPTSAWPARTAHRRRASDQPDRAAGRRHHRLARHRRRRALRVLLPEAQASTACRRATACLSSSTAKECIFSRPRTDAADRAAAREKASKRKGRSTNDWNTGKRLSRLLGGERARARRRRRRLLAEDVMLKMAVPDWPPTRIMKDLFDKDYKAPSGNNVTLEVDFIPWPDYYTRLNASLTSGEQKYNMAVSDSQWLGAFIEGGYYRKLNDIIDADPELQGDARRHASRPAPGLCDLSAQVARTSTAFRRCPTSSSPTTAPTCSATRTSRRLPGEVRREAAVHARGAGRRWTGTCSRRSASSSSARPATS